MNREEKLENLERHSDDTEELEWPESEEELEQMLLLAMYQKEIERKKLAAQLVMTQGEACSEEKLLAILRGNYREWRVSQEELEKGMAVWEEFYATRKENSIQVAVPWQEGMEAEVFADVQSPDGQLAVGTEAYRTRDCIVFELPVESVEVLRIIIYTHPVEMETEWEKEVSY